NRLSRRHFLQGAGVSLMLPVMHSLSRKAHAAAGPGIRYIQFLGWGGHRGPFFYPSDDGLSPNNGVYVAPLNSIAGDISMVIGPAFSNFKDRISLIRGLYVLSGDHSHNTTYPTCASGVQTDQAPPKAGYSIDAVLADSSKIYPDPTGMQRHVNFSPGSPDDS